MTIVAQFTPAQTSRYRFSRKLLFIASFAFIFVASLLLFNSSSSKVLAASTNVCGINTGNVKDYAGMVVYLRWATAADPTTYNTAHGVTATVTDATEPAGVQNVVQYPATANMTRQRSVTLPEIANNCITLDGASTYDNPVVLAYTTGADIGNNGGWGSAGSDGAPYVLDCDDLLSGGTLSTFTVTANGVPNGAPTGGSWTSWTGKTPNGYTTYVVLTYTPPTPLVTISGVVQTKDLNTGVVSPLAGVEVYADDAGPLHDGTLYHGTTNSSGVYTIATPSKPPAGDTLTISLNISTVTVPPGYSGPYADYRGAAGFTSASNAYNCGPSDYIDQITGTPQSKPSSSFCATVANDSDYNFIYINSPPPVGTGKCTNLSTSGTSPTFTAAAGYSLAAGVSYKSASFNWGDGRTSPGATNSGGLVTSPAHTYLTNGSYTVNATLSFISSSGTVTTSLCPPTTVTVGPSGEGPSLGYTCSAGGGAYNIQYLTNPTPTGGFIGAGYPATSISFYSSGGFDSDANHGLSLSPYPNQSSSLTVTGNSELGLSAVGPIDFTGSSSIATLPITNTAGMYTNSINYSAEIVTVNKDPSKPEVKTPVPPALAPPPGYSGTPTTSISTQFTTTAAGSSPTITYYTTEVATTTYTYSNTTISPGPPIYTCSPGWTPLAPNSPTCYRYTLTGEYRTTPANSQPGPPITTTTYATTTSTDTTYWITVATDPAPCPTGSINIADQPYLKVYGGDVMAGSGFNSSSATSCTQPKSSVIGWNWPQPPKYSGSGGEFAAYGLGEIDGFATNQASTTATAIGLSFANTATAPSGQLFGGGFGQVNCAPDFYGTMPASPTTSIPAVNNLTSGAYYSNGDLTINGGNVQDSQHPVIYVNGNVYIDGNINLGSTTGESWGSVSDIPSFELIVQGNIYIDPSVTNLDGIYVAQTGTIYDCATSFGQVLGSSYYNTCNNQLTVNGSFIGKNIDLMRTGNTLYQSGADTQIPTSDGPQNHTNAAEVFNYNPAIWLGLTSNNTSLDNYNSVISLPPVL
jgi:hypothetical protein